MTVSERLAGDLPVVDAGTAAASIPADATLAVSGFGSVGYPKAVPAALATDTRELSLTVISGGSVGDEIDTALVEAGAVERRYPYQARAAARDAANAGRVAFQDRHIARLGEDVLLGTLPGPDVAVVEAVAVGEGYLVPSTSIGQTRAFVEAADRLVVEVNHAQPLSLQAFHDIYRVGLPPRSEPIPLSAPGERIGGPTVPFDGSKLEAVVETDARDQPYEFREPTEADAAIAENLARFLAAECERNPSMADSVRLQFGVGSLGNALMSEFGSVDFGGRDVVYYGEVVQDGILDMLDEGTLEVASATSLALSSEGQDRLFEDVERYAEAVVLRPASLSNRAELVDRFGVVAVNSALEVDLYGNANSTHVGGKTLINGIGGSGDFARNGLLSVVALPSTVGDGSLSRVVPMVPHVDHTEHDVAVVVTEHGVADLRDRSPRERARLLLRNCADPSFRDDLRAYLDRADRDGGHVAHDLKTVFDWRSSAR